MFRNYIFIFSDICLFRVIRVFYLMARYLITSAIPYINGIKHLGNLVGSQLPADLYARYLRQRDNEVMFICATDEHGTPAEIAANDAGKPVADFCTEMHNIQAKIGKGFQLSFDYFGDLRVYKIISLLNILLKNFIMQV